MNVPMLLVLLASPGPGVPVPGPGVPTPLAVSAESQVWITGESNLNGFGCRGRYVEGNVVVDSSEAGLSARSATVRVPLSGLSCGLTLMNVDLREALRAGPATATELRVTSATPVPGDPAAVRLLGTLQVAGVERPVEIVARSARDDRGLLMVAGSHPLRMSDFGVTPPRRFGGLLRVHDEVELRFLLVLEPPRGG